MSYEIIITKTEVREVESGAEWTQVGEELLTEDDVKQSIYDRGIVSKDAIKLKAVFGYTPKIIKSETVTTEIYRQTMPEIDLPAVIRAINMMD